MNDLFESLIANLVILLWREPQVERVIISRDRDLPLDFQNKIIVLSENGTKYAQYILPTPEILSGMNLSMPDLANIEFRELMSVINKKGDKDGQNTVGRARN